MSFYSSSNHVYVWGDHSRTCASTAWEVGPSDAIAVLFRKWTVSMDEPLEVTGSIGLWIDLGLLTISQTRRHLFSKREESSKNFRRLAYGEHWGKKVIFLYSEDPYLASQHNYHRASLIFSRHRQCMQMQLPSIEVWFVRNLWHCTLDEWRRLHLWPTRLVRYFFLASASFISCRFNSLLQSPICSS